LFYGRAMLQWHSKEIAVGLPPKRIALHTPSIQLLTLLVPDVLNCLNPQAKPKIAPEPYVDPDPRKQMDNARYLAKYVFARQYGLASPFKFQTSRREAFKIPNFNDREIKGAFKTPKRLRDVIPMLEKLIWRHGKCRYKPLRDHACPSKVIPFCSPAGIMSICFH
ncbi:hypothetical protein C8R44DRAFT_616666, partial [Mycena epipterygia]